MTEIPERIPPLPGDVPYLKHWSLSVKDRIVLDIGADKGSTADFFLRQGAKQVIAVEGVKETYLELEENAKKIPGIIPIYKLMCDYGCFENLIKEYKPDTVKIDVEGSELYMIYIDNSVLRSVGSYMIEIHYPPILGDLLCKFVQQGFAVSIPMQSPILLYARRIE